MARVPLKYPLGGLSDNLAESEKTPEFTSSERNMRGIDPTDGKIRGAQRAGQSKFVDEVVGAAKVQDLGQITIDDPKIVYSPLEEDELTIAWQKTTSSAEVAYDVVTDRQGNVYTLDDGDKVEKRNSDGELLRTLNIPLSSSQAVVRKMAVDDLDRIYVGASSTTGQGDGTIWQFAPVDPDDNESGYDQQWELELGGGLADFTLKNGVLYCVINVADGATKALLQAYGFVNTAQPLRAWSQAVPDPVNAITASSSGAVFLASESNPFRGGSPNEDGFTSSVVSWTPHELANAEERIHLWLDAEQISGKADGAEMNGWWQDRRYVLTQATPSALEGQPAGDSTQPYADWPLDTTNRIAFPSIRERPIYRTYGIGSKPSVQFNGLTVNPDNPPDKPGEALLTYSSPDDKFKQVGGGGFPLPENKAPSQKGVFPGHRPSTNFTAGNTWTVFFVARLVPGDNAEYLMLQRSANHSTHNIGILFNAARASGSYVGQRESITLETDEYAITNLAIPKGTWSPTADNPANIVICTLHWQGEYQAAGPDGTDSESGSGYQGGSFLRINGRPMLAFTWASGPFPPGNPWPGCYGTGSNTVLGGFSGSYLANPSDPTSVGYTGDIGEILAILGDTSTVRANSTPCTHPLQNIGGGIYTPPPAGQNGASVDVAGWNNTPAGDPGSFTDTVTEIENIEGYLAHKWGLSHVLPSPGGVVDAFGLYPDHPYSVLAQPPVGIGTDISLGDDTTAILGTGPVVAKYGNRAGELKWAYTGSGVGMGVEVDGERGVLNVGERVSPSTVSARKIIDQGNSYSLLAGDGAWERIAAEQRIYKWPRLRVDQAGDLYWPRYSSNATNKVLKLSGEDGTDMFLYTVGDDSQQVYAVALPPRLPLYDDPDLETPEFFYVCSSVADGTYNLEKVRQVEAEQEIADNASPRRTILHAVCAGTIRTFTRGGSMSTPTGGSGALMSMSPYTASVDFFGEIIWIDGESCKVYDPRTDTVSDFESDSGGELPKRAKLTTAWGGRLLFARTPDQPNFLHMSQLGNGRGWDLYPPVVSLDQAFSGQSSRIGRSPDIITALIPATDDLLYIGGDHTIYRFTGDPMGGGRLDNVAEKVGISFGRSWTRDPHGTIYFFGSRGGVYRVRGDSIPERISEHRIERRLQQVDQQFFQVRLAWNEDAEGLHIFQVHAGTGGVPSLSWFYESKTDSWHEDDRFVTDLQPSCVAELDGDKPDDRVVVMGCEDGYLRQWDRLARNDDGYRIDSSVRMGPFLPTEAEFEGKFKRLQLVLATGHGGADYRWVASDTADIAPNGGHSGRVGSGRSPYLPGRCRGSAVWLEMRNGREDERWAFDSASYELERGGPRRVRAK